jgi:hypothetical protein
LNKNYLNYYSLIDSYEPPKTQVVRRFQNLGVQMVNPADYEARYGAQLEDAQTLVTHARQAGVVEDIVSISYKHKNYK